MNHDRNTSASTIRVSVVIPTLNEERNLTHVLPLMPGLRRRGRHRRRAIERQHGRRGARGSDPTPSSSTRPGRARDGP